MKHTFSMDFWNKIRIAFSSPQNGSRNGEGEVFLEPLCVWLFLLVEMNRVVETSSFWSWQMVINNTCQACNNRRRERWSSEFISPVNEWCNFTVKIGRQTRCARLWVAMGEKIEEWEDVSADNWWTLRAFKRGELFFGGFFGEEIKDWSNEGWNNGE